MTARRNHQHGPALAARAIPAGRPQAPGRLRSRVAERVDDPERGDVPGWVLVTLMTAGLVIALWAVAGPALTDVFNTAISRVTSVG